MASKPQEFCPYKGLEPYEEADQKYFFGRERDIEIIISNLCARSLTILYGASGVGKSSILLAGVTPKLGNEPGYTPIIFRDWQDANFADALKRKTLAVVSSNNPEAAGGVDLKLPLDKFLRKCARASKLRLLVIFDQFEEYFLYHAPSTNGGGDDFDSQFARAVNRNDLNVNFLLALRDDGLSKLDRFQARIPNLLGNRLRLEHLDREAAQSAICAPLLRYNQEYRTDLPATISGGERYVSGDLQNPTGLVARLLEDLKPGKVKLREAGFGGVGDRASAGIETPYLQMVLMRLWAERDRKTNQLDEQTYDRLGGSQNIVRTHLDNVMRDKFVNDENRHIAARLFQYLVTPENEKIALSQAVLGAWIHESVERVEPVINLLSASDVRILRPVDMVGQKAPQRYEIFHDVLAPAILGWRTRFIAEADAKKEAKLRIEQERLAAEARITAQEQQVRLERERAEEERQRAEHQRQLAAAEAGKRKAQEERAEAETRRAEEHVRASRRLGTLSRGLAAMVIVSIMASVFAVLFWRRAAASEGRAVLGRLEAEANAKIAEENARKADQNAKVATDNEKKANKFAEDSKRFLAEGKAAEARAEQMKRRALAAEARARTDRASAEAASSEAERLQIEASASRVAALNAQRESFANYQKAKQAQDLNVLYQSALARYRARDYQGVINILNGALPLIEDGSSDKAYALNLIGNSYSDLDKETDAVTFYGRALDIFRGKDRWGEAQTLTNLGDAYRAMKGAANKETAVQYYKSAISTYAQANWEPWSAPAFAGIGDIYAADYPFDPPPDQAQKAEDAYRQAVKLYKQQGDTEKAVATLTKIARLFNDFDQPAKTDKAYEAYADAASTYEAAQQFREAAKMFGDLGSLQSRHGKGDLAEKNYEKAAQAYERGGDLSAAARFWRFLALSNSCATCDKKKAANLYQQTIAVYEKIPNLSGTDRGYLDSSLTSIIGIYGALGDKKLADEYKKKLDTLRSKPK